MELKEIKVRYLARCGKCDREMKIGWVGYFDPTNKKLYCKICKETIITGRPNQPQQKPINNNEPVSPAMKVINNLVAQIGLLTDTVARIEEQFRDLNKDILAIDKYIRDNSKTATKKK